MGPPAILAAPEGRRNRMPREGATLPRSMRLAALSLATAALIALPVASAGATSTVYPPSLDFGSVAVGTTSAPQTATVTVGCTTDTGSPLFICLLPGIFTASQSITGDFAATNDCPVLPITSPGACTFTVTFTPMALGTRTGTLSVGTDAGGGPGTVSLSGNGVDPSAAGTGTGTSTGTTTAPSLLGAPGAGGTNTRPTGKCKKKKRRRHATAVTARKRCKRR